MVAKTSQVSGVPLKPDPASGGFETAPVFELARRLHHTVAQRLAGMSYLLAADSRLPGELLDRCRSEVDAALSELRDALASVESGGNWAGDAGQVDIEVRALLAAFPDVDLRWRRDLELEADRAGLVENFLVEGLRNVRKHAKPTRVEVTVCRGESVTVLEIGNDGVSRPRSATCGMGRRLLELEASLQGSLVESVAIGGDRWAQRIILPNR